MEKKERKQQVTARSLLKPVIFAGLSMRTRRAWGSYTKPEGARGGSAQTGRPNSGVTFSSWPSLSGPPRTVGSPSLCLSLDRGRPMSAAPSLERVQASSLSR